MNRKLGIKNYVLILFVLFSVTTVWAQSAGNSNKIDLAKVQMWPWEGSTTFNRTTKQLSMNIQWTGLSIPLNSLNAKEYNYLAVKFKPAEGKFQVSIKYGDGSIETSKPCTESDYSVYINLSSKKNNIDSITFQSCTEKLSVVINSIEFVKEIPGIVDAQIGPFDSSLSAIDLAKKMQVGWNLGQTMEAVQWENSKNSGLDSEIGWGEPYTTEEMIRFPKEHGFSTIRIPVTWYNHIIDDKYTIDPSWMNRVKTVVDWAIAEGYYVILNEHHSVHNQGPVSNPIKYGEGYLVRNTSEDIAESERFLKAVWTQIATAFNGSYDEHLIFETMNEPRNPNHEHEWWPGLKMSWGDFRNCQECMADYKILNEYNQVCLDAIRSTGRNNANRFVMIPALCTSDKTPLTTLFELPKDKADDKLLLTVHNYIMGPIYEQIQNKFTSAIKKELEKIYSDLNKKFVQNGIPVVVGETGAFKKISKTERIKWISYYSNLTSSYGMPIVYWDGGSSDMGTGMIELDRENLQFYEPDFVQVMLDNWKCK